MTAARKAPAARKGGKRVADPHDTAVERALSSMDDEHVHCRDFGHSWRPHNAKWLDREQVYESQLRCSRCGTVRTRWPSRTGAQLESKYDYADHYLVAGLGRLTGSDRDILRLRSIRSLLTEQTEGKRA